MRKPILLLAAVALGTAACSSSGLTLRIRRPAGRRPPPDHHLRRAAVRPVRAGAAARRRPTTGSPSRTRASTRSCPAERDRESTFALDVDTASYAIAQRYVDGRQPPRPGVRPRRGVRQRLRPGLRRARPTARSRSAATAAPARSSTEDEVLLRIGVKAKEVTRLERPDAALTFVIDTSGSMAREDRLGLVKQALTFLVDRLRPRDTVAIVEFGTDAQVVLEPTPASDADRSPRPSTRCSPAARPTPRPASRLGYQLASDALREGGINRVILASDGVANIGNVDPESILARGSARTRSRGSSSSPSASGWATTTTS